MQPSILQAQLDALWAKTARTTGATHPLLCHLIDVAEAARALWLHALPDALKRSVAARMGLEVEAAGRAWAFWAGCHDLGKAAPGFQRKYEPAMQRQIALGLPFPPEFVKQPCYHASISAQTLPNLLRTETGAAPPVAAAIATALGGHHGAWPSAIALENIPLTQIGGDLWDALRRVLILQLRALYAPPPVHTLGGERTARQALLALFSGFVSVADWIGSDESAFPFAPPPADPERYQQQARAQAMAALARHGWLDTLHAHASPASPAPLPSFAELFGYAPNAMQAQVIELAEASSAPSLVIVEAPTGMGKTEAALYLADRWLHRRGQRGLYVAMPTMATSNQMHTRVQGYLRTRFPGRAEPLLVHSMAQWMEPDAPPPLNLEDESRPQQADHVDARWFLQRKRSLLAPTGVGTVDQSLLAVLQARHFFVRLFGLSHKTLLFDEVHAYDTYMSALFERLLRWLRAVDVSVVVLTATLPQRTRARLLAAWCGDAVELPAVEYPAVTWASADAAGSLPIPNVEARRIALSEIEGTPDAIVVALRRRLRDGGHAAVLCNTVARAQTLYQAIRAAGLVEADDLILFHARTPFAWREQIEGEVLARYGKKTERDPTRRSIVVATQVIEQSLDIDFDLMISDLCPVDLLIQRAGRLHRHTQEPHRRDRPPLLAEPQLLIARTIGDDGLPRFGSDAFVYDEATLLRSWAALRGRTQLCTPDDTSSLIDWVYSDAPLPASENPDEAAPAARLAAAEAKLAVAQQKERLEAAQRLVPGPDDDALLKGNTLSLEEDDPTTHQTLQALTRLGPPTAALICLHAVAGRVNTEPGGDGAWIDPARKPTHEEVRALARNAVSIQRREIVDYLRTQGQTPRAWRDHALLSTHSVALFTQGLCQLPGAPFALQLDRELGLQYIPITPTRKEQE